MNYMTVYTRDGVMLAELWDVIQSQHRTNRGQYLISMLLLHISAILHKTSLFVLLMSHSTRWPSALQTFTIY